jgi:hypothetical protein
VKPGLPSYVQSGLLFFNNTSDGIIPTRGAVFAFRQKKMALFGKIRNNLYLCKEKKKGKRR